MFLPHGSYLVRRRITVTLSIFKFCPRFLAQIVENRETQLSRPFLGPGDNIPKSYDENQIRSEQARADRARFLKSARARDR
jgi:hypothetical protein